MGLFSSLGDTVNLVKQTFLVVKKNPQLVKPTFKELFWAILLFFMTAIAVVGYVAAFLLVSSESMVIFNVLGTDYSFIGSSFLGMVSTSFYILGFLLLFLFPFIKTYYRAAQTWMVYETFTGKPGTFADGIKRARANMKDIFVLTLLDVVFTYLANRLKRGNRSGGIIGIVLGIILFFIGKIIEEAWDLVGHYLLPACIIEDKNVLEAIPSIKNMKNNIPGALVGVFGVDFAGDLAKGLLVGILFVLGIGAIMLGFFLNLWWLTALLLLVYVGIFILAGVFIDMLKTVYFTLFYMAVNHPGDILPEFRSEVTSYLSYSTVTGNTSTSPASTKQSTGEIAEGVEKIAPFVSQYRSQGMTDAQIIDLLKRYGWSESIINKALRG
jgi:hypothetical protein